MRMKRLVGLLVAWLALMAPLSAGLVFENRVVEVDAGPDEDVLEVLFPFPVIGKEVQITSFDAPCSCLSAQISDGGRLRWKEGEKGVVKGIFELGTFKGTIEKYILLKVAGEPNDIKLTARVTIPELVRLDPPTLTWAIGGDPAPKILRVTMHHDDPIHLTDATISNPNFELERKTIEKGKAYELVVTPKAMNARALGMIRLRTDAEYKRHQRYQAFAMVRPSIPGS